MWDFDPQVYLMKENARNIILNESIDWEKSEVEVKTNLDNNFIATFNYKKLNYYFEASKIEETNSWMLMYDLTGYRGPDKEIFDRLKTGEIHNGVFAAVIRCIHEFIKVKHPEQIIFGTEDRELAIFYKRMIPYLTKKLLLTNLPQEDKNGKYNWIMKVNYEGEK